jgi:uncharacterized repeat protein (TIGR02543 family)
LKLLGERVKLSRHLTLFFVISFCFAALQIGCWQKNDKNPVAALPVSTLASSVAFKIVTPANQNASFSASIRSSSETPPFVIFELKLANFGNSLTPFSLLKKQAPVVNGSATMTFESLPNTTVVGSLQIENGNIDGCSNFHGAADLNQGSNIVELAPVGSLMPQDVLANAVSEIVSSSTLLLKAPATLATELAKIVSNLPLDSTSVYDEVLINFSNRTGLPLVELLAPTNAQTFTIGSSINIIASATDLDGSISKIEFYQNSTKIGEKSSLPFSLEWQPPATGTYAVYAKAIDSNAAVGVTASISVIVVDFAPTHTVIYNGNGSTGGTVPTDNQTYQQNATVTVSDNAGNLTKTGYSFAGWNTAADGSGTSYNPAATFNMGAANVTLYAKWSLVPTYTVTYNGNGNTSGTVPTDNQAYQQNATVTVADNTGSLTKTGYTFAGWNTAADGSGTNYNPAATFNMGATNITLYAKWSLVPTYTVTYNGNGNTSGTVPTDNQTYQQNTTVTVADNTGSLTKTGYTFAGWNTAADGSGTNYNAAATFNMGAVNVTLYAKWHLLINPHNVIYDGNCEDSGYCPIDSNLYEANASVIVLPNSGNLGKTGYTFDCWNTKADGSGFSYVAGSTLSMITTDLILYAKWRSNIPTWVYSSTSKSEINYALGRPCTSNSNPESCPSAVDGSNDTRWSSNRNDFGPDDANPHFLIVDLEQERNIKRIKVNIAGWDSYEQDFSIHISSDLENWVSVAYEENKTGIRTYFVTETARYVKFVSTYSADNGQVNLYELEVYGEIPTTYGVTYNGNGHTGGVIPTDVKNYVENDTVDVKDAGSLVKDGCSFVCWNTSPDGFGQNYFGSSNFNIGNSDVTLFAKWSSVTPATIVSANIGNLIGVPSGSFHRDSSTSENISYVSAFRMSQCEITQAQFVEITGLPNPSSFTTGSNLPVNKTSWYQTLVFCNKLSLLEGLEPAYTIDNSTNPDDWGPIPTNYDDSWDNVLCNWAASGYRLPTEAEWQWAAMGATDDLTKPFSGNGSLSDCVWYKDNSDDTTHIVGTKLPNELGIYDMSGNVREWCWDWAGNYPSGAKVDYRGPTNGTYRIARGDSYIDSDGWLYVFQRDLDVPYYPRSNLDTLGFRVVRQ